MEITYKPIGKIHSPFKDLEEMPIQPTSDASAAGHLEVSPEFTPGLKDLDGFSHIYIIYHLHEVKDVRLQVTPFLDKESRGVFATRAPSRPNPIGLSLVELVRVEGMRIYVDKLDVLDGTPLLDIKPYIPEFESTEDIRIGWLENARGDVNGKCSDARFK